MAKKPRTPAPPRPVQAPKRRDEPKRRVPARPSASGGRARVGVGGIPRFWLFSAGAAALVAVIVVVAVLVFGKGGGGPKPVVWSDLTGLQTGPPPWKPNFATLPARLAPLTLAQLTAEGGFLQHHHAYLALFVNGKRVTAPPNIGIYAGEWLTELHVHVGEPNIIHIESTRHRNFSLGEFFGVWGVKLTQNCVGRYCGIGKLHWWLDGKPRTGDPSNLVLRDHQVIAIAFGKPPAKIPSTFDFKGYGL